MSPEPNNRAWHVCSDPPTERRAGKGIPPRARAGALGPFRSDFAAGTGPGPVRPGYDTLRTTAIAVSPAAQPVKRP